MWTFVIFPLAFLAFGARRGVQVSVLIYLGLLTVYGNAAVDAMCGRAADDVRALLRRADLALYAAKREGRDRVVGIAASDNSDHVESPGDPD